MNGSLFISYSHLDAPWMDAVRKHLSAMLHERCSVWTDGEIPPGSTWEQHLLANLKQAAAALVLASPDYLVSPWCRRELKALHEMRQRGQLVAVYWLLLQPCGWHRSELGELQAVQAPASQALLDLPAGRERDGELLRCCDRVAGDMLRNVKDADPAVSAVRELLARSSRTGITVHSALAGGNSDKKGDFAIVCLGHRDNGERVVIKVLVNTPLHGLRKLFLQVGQARATITDPTAIRTSEVFAEGDGLSQRIVILGEHARGEALSKVMERDRPLPLKQRFLNIDCIGVLLRRLAETLVALHRLEPIEWEGGGDPYVHVMGPLVPQNVFYDTLTHRPQVAPLGVTNFLWYFFDPGTFRRMVNPKTGIYELPEPLHELKLPAPDKPEERLRVRRETLPKADQYFLGMLALELLECRPLFVVDEGQPRALQPRSFFDCEVKPAWAWRHEQLYRIVDKMLALDPGQRFRDMGEVVDQFRGLEEGTRALAKHCFQHHIAPPLDGRPWAQFAPAFYANFFASHPQARVTFAVARGLQPEAAASFVPDAVHHDKLKDALKAVLNFRAGGAPSAIDSEIRSHVKHQLKGADLKAFKDAFLQTLEQHLALRQVGVEDNLEMVEAWEELFAPVLVAMPSVDRQ